MLAGGDFGEFYQLTDPNFGWSGERPLDHDSDAERPVVGGGPVQAGYGEQRKQSASGGRGAGLPALEGSAFQHLPRAPNQQ